MLQHDARPTLVLHFRRSSIGLEVAPHPPNNLDLAPSDLRLSGALNRHLKEFHCTCDEDDLKLIGENVFENGLKDSTVTSSRNLLSTGGVVLN